MFVARNKEYIHRDIISLNLLSMPIWINRSIFDGIISVVCNVNMENSTIGGMQNTKHIELAYWIDNYFINSLKASLILIAIISPS